MNTSRKGRSGNRPPPPPPGDDENEDLQASTTSAEAPTEDIEVDELIANLGASAAAARIIVHRITPNNDPEECIDCPLPVFSKDHLRSEFGPGCYRCEVRHKGVIKRRWEWRFAAPLRAPAPATSSTDSSLAELRAELQASRERESARNHELITALLGRPQPQGAQLSDVLTALTSAKELLGGGGERGSPIAQLKELLEVRELLGGGDGETGAADVAKEGLKALREAFAMSPREPRAIAAQPQGQQGAPVTTAAGRTQAVLSLLVKHAAAATEPQQVAEFIAGQMQQLGEAEFEAACSFIEQDGAVGLVLMTEPRLANFRPWVEQVIAQLRAQIAPDPEEGGTSQPA